ncbi:MAG: leucine-rich repeat domain-containing protein [Bacteroidales bacterium]|nr:leucine-rich repeat domain-containing protein [Bacteroidales bacterium]
MKKTFTLHQMTTGGRKLSTLLAAFIMLLITTTSNTARAVISYNFVIDNLGYIINGDEKTVTLAGYDKSNEPSGELIIPATVTNNNITYNVTAIREYAFDGCSSLTSVTIPKGVTSIGDNAFRECTSLTSATIPEGVTKIELSLFYNCTSLTSVTIPESVTAIGMYAFNKCFRLTSVTIPKNVTSIGSDAFFFVKHIINKSQCTDDDHWGAIAENGTVEGDFVYENNTKTKLIAYIGKGGDVTIPKSVTSIGKNVFYNCTNCTSVTIPESVTSIGSDAFFFVKHIINKSQCIDYDHWGAFAENGTVVGDFVYEDNKKEKILAYIGKGGNVTIPDGTASIGQYAFSDCKNLTSVTFPESMTSIGMHAFSYCPNLTSVTIEGATTIAKLAFAYCPALSSVTITKDVYFIGNDVFYQCINVDNVYLYADPDNLSWAEADCNDFKASKATKCHVYADYRDKYEDKFKNFVNVTFVGDIKEVSSNDITISGISNVTYTGKAVEPIVVADGDKTLELGTDYTITYTNNINVGTAKATIEGIKLYIFTKEVEFTIAPKQISSATITLSQAEYEYTGKAITPEATVKDGDATLKLNTDYTITYADNTAAGTAKITIAGKGNYTGTVEKTFTIKTTSTPIATITDNTPVKVWSYNSTIYIESAPNAKYTIIDLNGRTIKSSTTKSSKEQININHSGIYLVIIDNQSFKVSL